VTSSKYRPDIDGLRALAIVPVVLFHAFPSVIHGGFIGVDIFFVISGFLIASILIQDINADRFSILNFYSRRIRRIFPALITVLFSALIAGWFLLLDTEYLQLAKHIVASAGFSSNFVLWSESGYFDNDATTKPLLHMWSLGIEEQFYIVWPLLLFFLVRKTKNHKFYLLSLTVISFAANIYLIGRMANVAAFYNPLTRFWELAIGGILAILMMRKERLIQHTFLTHLFSLLGIGLIALGFSVIHESKTFPGWWALMPVFGTTFLIAAGPATFVNRLLANRLFAGIGLISYPLYLWS
jgi:peptidoglycan/LPS O-acetylase OafA/YrhL